MIHETRREGAGRGEDPPRGPACQLFPFMVAGGGVPLVPPAWECRCLYGGRNGISGPGARTVVPAGMTGHRSRRFLCGKPETGAV